MVERCMKAKRAVQAIILDAGGILLHPDLDWLAAQASSPARPITRDALYIAYYKTIFEADVEGIPGRDNPAFTDLEVRVWFFTHLLIHCEVESQEASKEGQRLGELAFRQFPRESDLFYWAMPGTRETLMRLKEAGFILGVASNNDGALVAQLKHVGIDDLFDALMDSGVEGVSKPDPELLLRAARALAVDPVRCLFIGDVDGLDGLAARRAGMAFALLDPLLQPRPSGAFCITDLDAVHQYFEYCEP